MPTFVAQLLASCRMIGRRPGFAILAVLTIAIGVGATTAMFSVIQGVLLRPLALADADRIHEVAWQRDSSRYNLDQSQFEQVREHVLAFEHVAAATPTSLTLALPGQALRLTGLHVSADYFRVLGVRPLLGRAFSADEDQAGAPATLVISESLWRSQFNADLTIVGRVLRSGTTTFEVIGVMPTTAALTADTALWLPLAPVAASIGQGSNYRVLGRLRPEIEASAANAELAALSPGLRDQSQWRSASVTLAAAPLLDALTHSTRQPLYLLFAAVGLLMLIASANTANLLVARVSARERELSIRSALGGSSRTLALDVMMESLILALVGSLLGWLVATLGVDWLLSLRSQALLRQDQISVDRSAFGFALMIALVGGVGAGLPSWWLATRSRLAAQMRSGSAGSGIGAGAVALRRALVAGQIALSMVLLVGASLLIQTYRNLSAIDLGFPLERTLAAELWTQGSRHQSSAEIADLFERISSEAQAQPGARAAGVVAAGLPSQWGGNAGIQLAGAGEVVSADIRAVTSGYFSALQVPLRHGRSFDARDRANSVPVLVINETFARTLFGERTAIGARVLVDGSEREVIGVVGDLLSVPGELAAATVFMPMSQIDRAWLELYESWFPTHLVVASESPAQTLVPNIERMLRNLDESVPVGRVRSMEAVYATAIGEQRFHMLLLSVFAGLALLLSIVGVYGVLSFLVQRQSRQIGIQAALGADRQTLLLGALRKGMAPVAIGSVIGLVGSLLTSQWLATQLYGVDATHVPTLLTALLTLGLASLFACLRPALKAMATDPAIVLRAE